jgi:hypothetical protein
MKVKIREYSDWYGPYQLIDSLLFFMSEDKRFEIGEKFAGTRVGKLVEKIGTARSKYHEKRRVSVHIDKYDTWGMDSTLAPIILPMLRQLRDTKHGAPFTEDEDVPEYIRSTYAPPKENDWDTDVYHFYRWDWILNEMIYAFEHIVEDDQPYDSKRELRAQNGFRLFGKYYRNLWD